VVIVMDPYGRILGFPDRTTTAGTFHVGTVLQPCTCSGLPVISHMKLLNVVRDLVYSTLHISCCLRFCWPNFLVYRRVAVLGVSVCCIICHTPEQEKNSFNKKVTKDMKGGIN
jgi:hypothetical protein